MKNFHIYITYLLLSIVLLSACSKDVILDYTEDDFVIKFNIRNSELKEITIPNLLMGDPRFLRVVSESNIIIQDLQGNYNITHVDLGDGSFEKYVKRGKGPNEMIVTWGIYVMDSCVWINDPNLKKLISFKLIKRKLIFLDEFSYNKHSIGQEAFPTNNNHFVATSLMNESFRFSIFNITLDSIYRKGDFPVLYSSTLEPNNDIFSSYPTVAPNGENFALACSGSDIIDFYKSSGILTNT